MITEKIAAPVVIDSSKIMQTGLAFTASKVLLTAVKLDLFTLLAENAKTAEEIRTALGLHGRGLADFLDALVSLGFLCREGNGRIARYGNTLETDVFLDRKKESYVGGILVMANNRLYPFWNDLEEGLKTGLPQNETKNGGRPLFEEVYADENRLREFVSAMAGTQLNNFISFARKFDFTGYRTHCDIGGAGAQLSIQIVTHNPSLHSITFDLPVIGSVAQENIDKADLTDRVEVASGDFFKDEFPEADIITMGNILHDWNLEEKKLLIRKAYDALPEGGALAVIENIIDDERRKNSFGLLMSLNMLIETSGGFDYTAADFKSWALEIGFSTVELLHLNGPSSAVIAYK